ncbi:hypothetical protein [Leptolyngbya iicbica]|uniref:Uncharacterized protein n=2 Tax=Cyanophyceae TaxID=3028117 RepID=A0A4Q7E280_9CYAN|nr:hypothetical protein [Leptolyngbya sp. LK]RZM75354.1 hypothetical protein DYY88_20660 [Leptolyngbya sp. LK]
MHQAISDFLNTVIDKIATAYNEAIVSVVSDAPKSVVDFNNVAALKKGQRYIRKTDLIFNKAISALFLELFVEQGVRCTRQPDSKGRSLLVCDEKNYKHFISLEQTVTFPKVPWYREFNKNKQSDYSNTYVVLVENSNEGEVLVSNMNNQTASRNVFITLEDFTIQYFGRKLWDDLASALKDLESASTWHKWFDLAEVCTKANRQIFSQQLTDELRTFDYEKECVRYDLSNSAFKALINTYLEQETYKLFFSSDDFAMSFFSSEWLYKKYFHKDSLEKTYVILGYLKSLEQLLVYLVRRSCQNIGISCLIESKNRKGKKLNKAKEIDIDSDKFSSTELGSMIHYLRQPENQQVFNKLLDLTSINMLLDFIDGQPRKERNMYFHKQNIGDVDIVCDIRNRTLLVYCVILGALY